MQRLYENSVLSQLERFSIECRSLLRFCFTTLSDWFEKLAPIDFFTNQMPNWKQSCWSHAFQFLRLAPVTCICFEFWLVPCVVFIFCDRPEWLLWFWFYYTQWKTALSGSWIHTSDISSHKSSGETYFIYVLYETKYFTENPGNVTLEREFLSNCAISVLL